MHHAVKALTVTATLGVTSLIPVLAQQNNNQQGLVNIGNVTVQVPIAVAANLCGVAVNVLVSQIQNGQTTCDAVARAPEPQQPNQNNNQRGLVNIGNVNVQVPIAIAANICGVAVSLLTQAAQNGPVTCYTDGTIAP